ncbi:hypothetical protein E7X19_26110, partial [Bacteroides fragilis]
QTGQQDKHTQHRINQRRGDEKILYAQAGTKNIIDSQKKERFESYLNEQHRMSQDYDKEGFNAYYNLERDEQYRIAALYYDQTGQQDKHTQHRINQRRGDEKILYAQAGTKNI